MCDCNKKEQEIKKFIEDAYEQLRASITTYIDNYVYLAEENFMKKIDEKLKELEE